ncbi:hypothetical protein [Streptomyces hesseae]|uniref:Uncharacterized protein n=1 Tax=Streptomyces hesseae TaxID=3075519 RepID=A0ABU2SLZ5_9ACTN|nr:hypothetical protein [Streptomyces sp. DSM 40473]MDT0449917.1 hypothetical protein [Streptomyces sp. DSM 40473]
MSEFYRPGLFASVERQCVGMNPTPRLRLRDGSDGDGVSLELEQSRRYLYDRSVDPAVRADLWHQIAERRLSGIERSDWPTAVVWLGLPGLRRTAFRITWYFRADREDVESELVACYLEALAEVGAHTPDPGDRVLRAACSRAWTLWRKARPETAVENVEGAARLPSDTETEDGWEVDYDPPASPRGLSATVRITVPAHRVEGVRIGALARRWGLADTATSTGYAGRGRQVATLSLRRVGGNG